MARAEVDVAMDEIAREIYCTHVPGIETTWEAQCEETRSHYIELASAAFMASVRLLQANPELMRLKC